SLCSAVVCPEVISGNTMGFLITQIPHKAIQASFRLDFLFWLLIIRSKRLVGFLGFGARIFPNQFSRRVEYLQLRLRSRFRGILQVVIDHGAWRRILARPLRGVTFLSFS